MDPRPVLAAAVLNSVSVLGLGLESVSGSGPVSREVMWSNPGKVPFAWIPSHHKLSKWPIKRVQTRMAGLGCWAGGWCWGRTGDTHRTNVEQLHRNFFLNNTDGYIKPKIFPHNKLNKNVRFMPVVIVILSVQLSLGTALSRSLPSVELQMLAIWNWRIYETIPPSFPPGDTVDNLSGVRPLSAPRLTARVNMPPTTNHQNCLTTCREKVCNCCLIIYMHPQNCFHLSQSHASRFR